MGVVHLGSVGSRAAHGEPHTSPVVICTLRLDPEGNWDPPSQALEGLMKDAEGRDIAIPSSEGEEQLVDYQGMLVSGAIAQRRGWV